MSPFSLYLSYFLGSQSILGYVRPWRIAVVHPPETGKRRSICGLYLEEHLEEHLEEPLHGFVTLLAKLHSQADGGGRHARCQLSGYLTISDISFLSSDSLIFHLSCSRTDQPCRPPLTKLTLGPGWVRTDVWDELSKHPLQRPSVHLSHWQTGLSFLLSSSLWSNITQVSHFISEPLTSKPTTSILNFESYEREIHIYSSLIHVYCVYFQ